MFTGRLQQLTIVMSEGDMYHRRTAHLAILELLRRDDCSSAMALRSIAGIGAS
jgi:PII-like signaling protein